MGRDRVFTPSGCGSSRKEELPQLLPLRLLRSSCCCLRGKKRRMVRCLPACRNRSQERNPGLRTRNRLSGRRSILPRSILLRKPALLLRRYRFWSRNPQKNAPCRFRGRGTLSHRHRSRQTGSLMLLKPWRLQKGRAMLLKHRLWQKESLKQQRLRL